MDKLLNVKQIIKKKTPAFIRTSGITKVRLKNTGWRRPKGITNKMRLQEHGHRGIVKKGFGTPKELRGIGNDGKIQVLITNISDLAKVGKDSKGIIATTIGLKKRIQIIEEAKKRNINISNINDVKLSQKIQQITAKRHAQQNKKDKRLKKKEAIEKSKVKKDKVTVEEKINEEEKIKEEKLEKDKILTQKD